MLSCQEPPVTILLRQKNNKMKKQITFIMLSVISTAIQAQIIRGTIKDAVTNEPIPFATVLLVGEDLGTAADENGQFQMDNAALGRHTVQVSSLGYETAVFKEVMITGARHTVLDVELKESSQMLDAVNIRPVIYKESTLNRMVAVGGRMFSVDEAARFAGGFDDPARLATSFAGVASGGSNNGISIHGNAPHLLLWRLEDVEIPNPNHYADISVLGGGIFSSLSAQVIGNSDFLSSAFPAEYSNAVSGVFDMKMRTGNASKHEHTFQVGVGGIDLASEGPVGHKGASYIINYRYSMTGLIDQLGLIDMEDQKLNYQDLNFKINMPVTDYSGVALWGTGFVDRFDSYTPQGQRVYRKDYMQSYSNQIMGAAGLSYTHGLRMGQIKSAIAVTAFGDRNGEDWLDDQDHASPHMILSHDYTNLIAKTTYLYKWNPALTTQLGAQYTHMFYDMNMTMAQSMEAALEPVYNGNGNSGLLVAFMSNSWHPTSEWTVNLGLNWQYMSLNDAAVLEPRIGLTWHSTEDMSLSLGYGLHSRTEKTDVYFVNTGNGFVNRGLGFTKAHHVMLSWNWNLTENLHLRVEPYYQYLFDVPVEEGTSYSVLNRTEFFLDKALVNKGLGRNYGIDVTLERYLNQGWYGMISSSLFSSRYTGGDNVWHSTRYDRRFIINGLIGKEWTFNGGKKVASLNLKATYQGGDRTSAVDIDATMSDPSHTVHYDESDAFCNQYAPMFIFHYTASLRINRKHCSHEWSLKHVNATGTPSYYGHEFNELTGEVESGAFTFSLPNLSYKIEF